MIAIDPFTRPAREFGNTASTRRVARSSSGKRSTFGRLAFACSAVALTFLTADIAHSQTVKAHPMTMEADLANRSPAIHWPEGFNPSKADLFAHNELLIDASCDQVWQHIIEAPAWPSWYPNSKDVRLSDPGAKVLQQGSTFTWTTFDQPLESKVHEFVPSSRIGWFGGSHGEAPGFYHTFYLKPEGDACRVITEEMGIGSVAQYVRKTDEGLMHRGHDLWLATLKWVSEK